MSNPDHPRIAKLAGIIVLCAFGFALMAWASDLPPESHPSILYNAAMLPTIQQRASQPFYAEWWQGVVSLAQQGLAFNFNAGTETQKARYCKVLAFAYAITGSQSYAQKCLEGLQLINPSGNWGAELHNHADPLMCYCEAYDMLKGSGYSFGASETQIRTAIAQKAQEFRTNYTILLYLNNWRVRYLSALGLAAMTLADNPSAEDWHDYAESMIANVFDNYQVVGEGAWAEGPYYLEYSADIYMSYMLAYHRLISGADFINNPTVRAAHDWSWMIRLPNGARPNFEDAHLSYFYGGFLASVYDHPGLYQWDYLAVTDSLHLFPDDYWQVDAISYVDENIPATPPQINATIFLPDAGQMIFRSGWGFDDIYLFLIGEHGAARINGQGHDHADATSFILYAYGEMLALDAGYISWAQRTAVNKAKNHSLILVDGQGPPASTAISAGDADAYLKNFCTTGSIQYCEDSTYYRNVSIKRSALFCDSSFFIFRDRIFSAASHSYAWRLHGNGGGSSGGSFVLLPEGAIWNRTAASLQAAVSAADALTGQPLSITFSATADTHSFAYNQILTHSTLNAQVNGSSVEFLSVMYPRAVDAPPSAITILPCSTGAAIRVDSNLVATAGDAPQFSLPGAISGFDDILTDANWFYAQISAEQIKLLNLHAGSVFSYGGDDYIAADQPLELTLDRRGLIWDGYVSGGTSYRVNIWVGNLSPEQATFNGNPIAFSVNNSVMQLDLNGSGYFQIELVTSAATLPGLERTATDMRLPNLKAIPNPFNPVTCIDFFMPSAASATLSVFDARGRAVASWPLGFLPPGRHQQSFDATGLPSGIYFARLQAADWHETLKMLLLK